MQVLGQERAFVPQRLKQDKSETGMGSQAGPAKPQEGGICYQCNGELQKNLTAGHRCAAGPEWLLWTGNGDISEGTPGGVELRRRVVAA